MMKAINDMRWARDPSSLLFSTLSNRRAIGRTRLLIGPDNHCSAVSTAENRKGFVRSP
jgi:hypothetical protein